MTYDIDNFDRYTVVVASPPERHLPRAMFRSTLEAVNHRRELQHTDVESTILRSALKAVSHRRELQHVYGELAILRNALKTMNHRWEPQHAYDKHVWQVLPMDVWRARYAATGRF